MHFTPIAPMDLKGTIAPHLIEKAEAICEQSAILTGGHNQSLLDEVRELLRITNSYYSNRIESEGTHPINIEKAMKKEFKEDAKEKNLQLLSLSHIRTQKEVETLIADGVSAFDTQFVKSIHRSFYADPQLDSFLSVMDEKEKQSIRMTPGDLRTHDVYIGKHIAPAADAVSGLMSEFQNLYESSTKHLPHSVKLVYALSSHHRLVWIHPFLDGNGRTSRLALDAAILSLGLKGYGLWNMSRGLARGVDDYKKALQYADMERQGATDGRGALSLMALTHFVDYMLDIALDQVQFMGECLKMDKLSQRIENYIILSRSGMFGIQPLPKYAEGVFKHLLLYGSSQKGTITAALGISERTGTTLFRELSNAGVIASNSVKGPISLRFTMHMASYIFPDLFPIAEEGQRSEPKKGSGRPKKL
jgi:Fic family protein